MIIADTNLIATIFLDSPNTPVAEAVLERDPYWVAPDLWRYEFKNVLTTQVRFAGLAISRAIEMFAEAELLVQSADTAISAAVILQLAAQKKLSAYDAEYLALAQALGVRVVTFDRGLLKADSDFAVTPREFAET